jgi:hypothetical protein
MATEDGLNAVGLTETTGGPPDVWTTEIRFAGSRSGTKSACCDAFNQDRKKGAVSPVATPEIAPVLRLTLRMRPPEVGCSLT